MSFNDNSIKECADCGDRPVTGKYCANCKTQAGRKKIFDANAEIQKERKAAGLPCLETLKDWK